MYIRKIPRKNKDGSTVTYVQLAHNARDPQKGFAVAKVIYNFGRLEDLDIEQLKRLVRSISRYLTLEEHIIAPIDVNEPNRLEIKVFSKKIITVKIIFDKNK